MATQVHWVASAVDSSAWASRVVVVRDRLRLVRVCMSTEPRSSADLDLSRILSDGLSWLS